MSDVWRGGDGLEALIAERNRLREQVADLDQKADDWTGEAEVLRAQLEAVTRERAELRALVEAFMAVEGSGPPKRWPAVQALIDWLAAHPEGDNGERRS